VEVNPLVVDFVRGEFRDFTGSPYDLPGVSFEIEDGRTYTARSRDRFDMIQLSAVDTTAALAAGALSLVENSLYTVEAFQDYHDRLSDEGLLAITRNWTMNAQLMALRTADIVQQAWRSRGHDRPGRHLVIIAPGDQRSRWGTLLASRRPFDAAELARIRQLADERGFKILYQPKAPAIRRSSGGSSAQIVTRCWPSIPTTWRPAPTTARSSSSSTSPSGPRRRTRPGLGTTRSGGRPGRPRRS
jgi:spermidine synthase